jgi:hypothetical protein
LWGRYNGGVVVPILAIRPPSGGVVIPILAIRPPSPAPVAAKDIKELISLKMMTELTMAELKVAELTVDEMAAA